MNAFRCVLAVAASCALLISPTLRALDCTVTQSVVPLAVVGTVYGILHTCELLFAAAVSVKLKANLREQHLLRQQVRSQRLKKARR